MMRKLCFLLLLMTGFIQASNVTLEDYQSQPKHKWISPWAKDPNAAIWDKTNGVMQLDLSNGYVELQITDELKLENFKNIEIDAESSGDNNGMRFYIIIKKGGASAHFYSDIFLQNKGPVQIPLRSGGTALGGFRFAKSTGDVSRMLDSGSVSGIMIVSLSPNKPLKIKLRSIRFIADSGAVKVFEGFDPKIVSQINSHKKNVPYQFSMTDSSGKVDLLKDGKSEFRIVISSEKNRFMAEELQRYFKLSTGAELPIVKEKADKGIYLETSLKNQNGDAFILECKTPDRISISGASERALAYGVYDFLEKSLGIRFFMPHPGGEVIPRYSDLQIQFFQDLQVPAFENRFPHYSTGRYAGEKHLFEDMDWLFKNRYNGEQRISHLFKDNKQIEENISKKCLDFYALRGGYVQPLSGEHNLQLMIPPKEYFKNHPEYFCFDKALKKWQHELSQICCTNKDVARIIANRAEQYFRENPKAVSFPIIQEDGPCLWCECQECEKLNPPGFIRKEDGNSDRNINLCNMVGELLEKNYPEKLISTFAYISTRKPPRLIKPRSNICVVYCVPPNKEDIPLKPEIAAEMAEWARLTDGKVLAYDYMYCNPMYIYTLDRQFAPRLRFMTITGIRNIRIETGDSWGNSAYSQYLAARLQWDPWLDESVLRTDYFAKLYGSAGPLMDKFNALLQDNYTNKANLREVLLRPFITLTPTQIEQLTNYLNDAKKLATGNEQATSMLKRNEAVLEYYRLLSAAVNEISDHQLGKKTYQDASIRVVALEKFLSIHWPKDEIVGYADGILLCNFFKKALQTELIRQEDIIKYQEKYHVECDLTKLNWKFAVDPDNVGETEKWYYPEFNTSKWENIKIGASWESQAHSKYDGYAWYAVKFDISTISSTQLELLFMGVDERAWVYLDGQLIGGRNEGDPGKIWLEPFLVKLPSGLKSGEHYLVVQVHDSVGDGGIYRPAYLVKEKK